MSLKKELGKLSSLVGTFAQAPRPSLRLLGQIPSMVSGFAFGRDVPSPVAPTARARPAPSVDKRNPLRDFFERRRDGRGIWKWEHYFEVYHRHLAKFVGADTRVLEIGVYSGGSLEMWRDYFGGRCRVLGVDLQDACRAYENEHTRIYIGDQANRSFWQRFRQAEPQLDVLIDDGGHRADQQIVTLEEMLPHLSPGGVYICEDVHGEHHSFTAYMLGLVKHLNAITKGGTPTPLQNLIRAVSFYPYITVIERSDLPVEPFNAPKQGTEWAPFKTT
jgi:hypothetical protein